MNNVNFKICIEPVGNKRGEDNFQYQFVPHPQTKKILRGKPKRFLNIIIQSNHRKRYERKKKELEERAAYAKKWLAEYAPEKFVFKLQDTLPPAAKNLSPEQKRALAQFADFIKSSPEMKNGEELHQKLHELKEFKAVYLAFLGKESGPKAGWFLSVLDREFVLRRLKEASA